MNKKIDVSGIGLEQALFQLELALKAEQLSVLEISSSDQQCTTALLKLLADHAATCEVFNSEEGQTIIASFSSAQVIRQKSYVVGSNTLGKGEELLGGKLMTAFFNISAEYDQVPASMFFLNSGAKLCIEGADTLSALQQLEEKGTEIIVCGTCLSFFDIKDKLAVGRAGSMHDFISICHNQSEVINL